MQNGFHSLVLFPWLVNDAVMKKIEMMKAVLVFLILCRERRWIFYCKLTSFT
jgi:hypothetical protein